MCSWLDLGRTVFVLLVLGLLRFAQMMMIKTVLITSALSRSTFEFSPDRAMVEADADRHYRDVPSERYHELDARRLFTLHARSTLIARRTVHSTRP